MNASEFFLVCFFSLWASVNTRLLVHCFHDLEVSLIWCNFRVCKFVMQIIVTSLVTDIVTVYCEIHPGFEIVYLCMSHTRIVGFITFSICSSFCYLFYGGFLQKSVYCVVMPMSAVRLMNLCYCLLLSDVV